MGCENGCLNEHRIKNLEKDLEMLSQKNSRDHEKFFDKIENNEKSMIESQGDRQNIRIKLEEISGDVKTIMQTPSKRYDTIITSALTAVIGALIGYIMSGFLPI